MADAPTAGAGRRGTRASDQNSSVTPMTLTPPTRRVPSAKATVPRTMINGTAGPGSWPTNDSVKNFSPPTTTVCTRPIRFAACWASVARTESPTANDPAMTIAASATANASPRCHQR